MNKVARVAVIAAASVAAVPFASASSLIYGHLNTVGAANYNYPPEVLTVSSSGAANLDLLTSGSPSGSNTGLVTGPPATGSLSAFDSSKVTDYSFSTSMISGSTPTRILSVANGTDTLTFFATSTGAFTPTSLPATEGALMLYGYLADSGPTFATDQTAELDIAANGIGNNFTEDLTAAAPEPSSLMLLGTGLLSASGMLLRRRNAIR